MSDYFEEEAKFINSDSFVVQEFNTIAIDSANHKLNIVYDISTHGPRVKVMDHGKSVMELPLSKDNKGLDKGEVIAGSINNRKKLSKSDKELYDLVRDICYKFSDRIIAFEYKRLDSKAGEQLEDDMNNYIKNIKDNNNKG